MRAFKPGFLAVLGLSLLLGGCLESKKPLFDQAQAVTPAPEGHYRQQRFKYGKWEEGDAGMLTTDGRSYRWKPEGEDNGQFFTAHDVGSGFYIVAERPRNAGPDDPYVYALFQAAKDGVFLAYTPTCSDIMQLRLPEGDLPAIEGSDCIYSDRDTLVRSLTRYAEVMQPTSRFVPLK